MRSAFAFGFVLALGLGAQVAVAQEGAHEHGAPPAAPPAAEAPASGASHGMGQGGMMGDMHIRMTALHDHSRKMEGIDDPKQLGEEMKRHMRMMDEMMAAMMKSHEAAGSASPAPHTP